jgi:hypothetical protein
MKRFEPAWLTRLGNGNSDMSKFDAVGIAEDVRKLITACETLLSRYHQIQSCGTMTDEEKVVAFKKDVVAIQNALDAIKEPYTTSRRVK